jgi:hypothetical protein
MGRFLLVRMVLAWQHVQTRDQHRDIIWSPLGMRFMDEGTTDRLFVNFLGQ